MHNVSQGQREGLCQDGISQELNKLLIGSEDRGHKEGLQWYI